jgi:hypothetical protein
MTKTYDRSDGETSKAYAAFTIYRNMGVSRSLKATTEKYYSAECPSNVRRAKGMRHIEEWSSKYNWVARCKDYDADREQERRQIKSEHEKAAYLQDLENYHLQQKAIGMTALRFAIESIESISLAIEPIRQKMTLYQSIDPKEWEIFCQAQVAAKNVMAVAVSGADIAARGLMIGQMLESNAKRATKAVEGEIEARSGRI